MIDLICCVVAPKGGIFLSCIVRGSFSFSLDVLILEYWRNVSQVVEGIISDTGK